MEMQWFENIENFNYSLTLSTVTVKIKTVYMTHLSIYIKMISTGKPKGHWYLCRLHQSLTVYDGRHYHHSSISRWWPYTDKCTSSCERRIGWVSQKLLRVYYQFKKKIFIQFWIEKYLKRRIMGHFEMKWKNKNCFFWKTKQLLKAFRIAAIFRKFPREQNIQQGKLTPRLLWGW